MGHTRRDEELGKYKSLYEDHMNPFEVFKGKVSDATYYNIRRLMLLASRNVATQSAT